MNAFNPEFDPHQPAKFLYYAALLNQVDEADPTARVLNRDAVNFMGYWDLTKERVGEYKLKPRDPNFRIEKDLISVSILPDGAAGSSDRVFVSAKVVVSEDDETTEGVVDPYILIACKEGDTMVDNALNNTLIEIKTRVRGDAPKLIYASFSEDRTLLELIFNKTMSPDVLYPELGFASFQATKNSDPEVLEVLDYNSVNGNVILLDIPEGFFGDSFEYTLSSYHGELDDLKSIESFDYGKLADISSFRINK